jgi:hypothetical protein
MTADRSHAQDRPTDDRLADLAQSNLRTAPALGEVSEMIAELVARRAADPTLDELGALVDVRDRLDRIVSSDLHNDPNAIAAKAYVDRVLAAFYKPLLERGSQRSHQPREEFLAVFREAHATLHRLWTAAVGKDLYGAEGYDKAAWKALDNALSRFARDAAEKVGISQSEPLL